MRSGLPRNLFADDETTEEPMDETVTVELWPRITKDEVLDAIKQGVKEAFDQLWPSQIQDAISIGVHDAIKGE